LNSLTQSLIAKSGQAIIIDCHSYSSTPFNRDPDQRTPRADICFGTDEKYTPSWLDEISKTFFTERGLSVALNQPSNQWGKVKTAGKAIDSECHRLLYEA